MKPRRPGIAALAAGFVALAAAAGESSIAAPAASGPVAETRCPPDLPGGWRCLSIAAPARYDGTSAKTAPVRVVVAPARRPKAHPEAVFLLQGFPGGSGTAVAGRGFVASIGALQEDRDLVVVDQRAVSGPEALTCPPEGLGTRLAAAAPDPLSAGPLSACRIASEARYDLATLTTATFAEDLETVRTALGYAGVELYAADYGGRIAQQYLRRHGDHVLGAMLADIGPMDDAIVLRSAGYKDRAVEAVLRACGRDAACARAYPQIGADYAALKREMQAAGGLDAQVVQDGVSQPVRLPAESVAAFFGAHFHFMRDVAKLPFEIHALAAGGTARGRVAADILAYQAGVYRGVAIGQWLAVRCAEDEPSARGRRAADRRLDALSAACRGGVWGSPPTGFRAPVSTDAPILVLTSPMEPDYPAAEGRRAARGFHHVRVIEAANHGHVFDDDWNACLGPQAVLFLQTLDLGRVDGACAAAFGFRPFKIAP